MVTAPRAAKEKAIIELVILDYGGLTFKPPMEKVKAESWTKAFYEPDDNVPKQQDTLSLWQI